MRGRSYSSLQHCLFMNCILKNCVVHASILWMDKKWNIRTFLSFRQKKQLDTEYEYYHHVVLTVYVFRWTIKMCSPHLSVWLNMIFFYRNVTHRDESPSWFPAPTLRSAVAMTTWKWRHPLNDETEYAITQLLLFMRYVVFYLVVLWLKYWK